MKPHIIPFENRWTNGERAWQWHCELERLGVPNWLAFRDRRTALQQRLWRAIVIGLGLVAVSSVKLGANG